VPSAHYEITKKALLSGKHTYSEKPLAAELAQGEELVALAEEKGLFLAAAPDTFLGGGLQACKRLIDGGKIGMPIFAQGFMLGWGPERFHPNPSFFYQDGAGPLFDMGPYYLTALTSLFGPVKRVSGHAKKTYPEREVLAAGSPKLGERFSCDVDTFVSASLEFSSGLIANLNVSWDMAFSYWESGLPLMQVFGGEGVLVMPDPNTFGGVGSTPRGDIGKFVQMRLGAGGYEEIPVVSEYIGNCRGLGLADMALCIRNGGAPAVSGARALHVLEIMHAILESSRDGKPHVLKTTCESAAPFDVPYILGKNN
jgi:predicted dehydrogenase